MEKHLKNYSGSTAAAFVIFLFLGLFIYTKLAGPIPFTINNYTTSKNDLFQAEGQGSASMAPDILTISFGVTKNAGTVADAQNQTNTVINSILENLKSLGVSDKDLKTTNYSISPNYTFEGTQKISGYTVTQNIDLKIKDIKNTNKTIDTITASGGNLVGQVQFGFDDKTKEKLEEQARKEAVDNARKKAQSLASVSGVRLGKIINVTESQDNFPRPIPFESTKAGIQETPSTNITPGENSIKISVTLTYEIY